MAYCAYCGALLPNDARFCSSCGAAVTQETTVASASPTVATTVYTGDGYAVMLVGTGSCSLSAAADLISDTCGYTDAEAMNLAANAPTLIARSLNQSQAAYLAQCLTEYGMEAAIYDRNSNQTFVSDVSSVFDNSGSFLTKVATALGLIGIGNRITGAIRKLTLPSQPPVYRMPKPAPKPPVRRHVIARQTAPVPHMQRDPLPHMQRDPVPHPHQKPERREPRDPQGPQHYSREANPTEKRMARQPEKRHQPKGENRRPDKPHRM